MNDREKDSVKTHRLYAPGLAAGRVDGDSVSSREVLLPAGEVHHALHVLRLRQGESVELFDGMGRAARGVISRAGRSELAVTIEAVQGPLRRRGPTVELAFAVPKGNRLDWLLEKATELGAAALVPVVFERSIAGTDDLSDNKMARWQGHCIAAGKQSGLDYLPEIRQPVELGELLRDSVGKLCLLGDPSAVAVNLSEALAGRASDMPVRLIVGPEGGLSTREIDACIAAGCRRVRIGWTTLRVETAAIALLAGTMAIAE